MKGYLSVQENARKWNVSVRWVNQYILAGRIPGCERLGYVWAIFACYYCDGDLKRIKNDKACLNRIMRRSDRGV